MFFRYKKPCRSRAETIILVERVVALYYFKLRKHWILLVHIPLRSPLPSQDQPIPVNYKDSRSIPCLDSRGRLKFRPCTVTTFCVGLPKPNSLKSCCSLLILVCDRIMRFLPTDIINVQIKWLLYDTCWYYGIIQQLYFQVYF